MAKAKPAIVRTSWALLKFSLRTSNVFDGAIRVKKRSWPYAKTSDVDSSTAGEVMIRLMPATYCGISQRDMHRFIEDTSYLIFMGEDSLGIIWY